MSAAARGLSARKKAEQDIRAILDGLTDGDLPKGRTEIRAGKITLWFGGMGHNLGTAKRNGEREPDVIRSNAILSLFEAEAAARADRELLGGESA